MEKKKLDQAAVITCMGGDEQSKTALVIAIIMIVTVILAPLGIVLLIARKDQRMKIQQLKARLYRLQPDSVFRKYYQRSVDSYDVLTVNLNNYGTYDRGVEFMFRNVEPGDKLYLLQNAKGKLLYVFKEDEWELDETAFARDGKYYYPLP